MSKDEQINIFALTNDYFNCLIFYRTSNDTSIDAINEENLLKHLKSNELIHASYIVNEKKNLIVVLKESKGIYI